MTKHGKMIADIVLASYDHPTAEQIYLRIRERGVSISMATVYNNLKSLVDEGIIQKLSMDGSPDRFDKPTHHEHLICSRCGKLSDVTLASWKERIEKETGLTIESYDLRIQYICEECRAKEQGK